MTSLIRKQENITTPLQKINPILVGIMLVASFFVMDIYQARSEIFLVQLQLPSFNLDPIQLSFRTVVLLMFMSAVLYTLINEIYMEVYYYFAYKGLNRRIPFTKREFKQNFRPFIILRNLMLAPLSLLKFINGGMFVAMGTFGFEFLTTSIVIILAFYYFKKHYIKEGYTRVVLLSFVIPFIAINGLQMIFSLINVI